LKLKIKLVHPSKRNTKLKRKKNFSSMVISMILREKIIEVLSVKEYQ